MKPLDEIEQLIAEQGSIRKAAPILDVDERTVRRWIAAQREPELPEVARSPMKILAIDIETKPHKSYHWDMWKQNIGAHQVIEWGGMFSFAAKWIHEGANHETEFWSDFHDGHERMLAEVWYFLDQADVIVHYNGEKFDTKHIRRELVMAGFVSPSPFKQVDLLKTVRKQFDFPLNKLAVVAPLLGLEDKAAHEGFALWTSCMDDDPDAWERMRNYNIQDVELTEQLYFKLRDGGWLTNHPSHAAMMGRDVCPTCASEDLRPAGTHPLQSAFYPRFVCGNCRSYSRGNRRIEGTGIVRVTS